jgi:hypothetical protein
MILMTWPIPSYGGSTGLAPIQVKRRVVATRVQNFIFLRGLNFLDFDLFMDSTIKKATDIARAITPPSFDGIDRKIA